MFLYQFVILLDETLTCLRTYSNLWVAVDDEVSLGAVLVYS
jgi:hypothetical protein